MTRAMTPIVLATFCIGAVYGSRYAAAGDMAQEAILAWNTHDPDKVAAKFTDDAVYEDVTLGVVNHGPGDIRKLPRGFSTSLRMASSP